jgi:hypothetical protein
MTVLNSSDRLASPGRPLNGTSGYLEKIAEILGVFEQDERWKRALRQQC